MSLPLPKPNLSSSPQFWLRTFGRIDGTVLAMSASIAALHLVGWFTLIAVLVPQQLSGIVGLFIATWLVALAVWRCGRIEERGAARAVSR
jgi:hypothetical protein